MQCKKQRGAFEGGIIEMQKLLRVFSPVLVTLAGFAHAEPHLTVEDDPDASALPAHQP